MRAATRGTSAVEVFIRPTLTTVTDSLHIRNV
jgi:hypothetical protein